MRITLQGGRVIDPAHGLDAVTDLHIADGRIAGLLALGLMSAIVSARKARTSARRASQSGGSVQGAMLKACIGMSPRLLRRTMPGRRGIGRFSNTFVCRATNIVLVCRDLVARRLRPHRHRSPARRTSP